MTLVAGPVAGEESAKDARKPSGSRPPWGPVRHDGTYHCESVPPGSYEVWFEERVLPGSEGPEGPPGSFRWDEGEVLRKPLGRVEVRAGETAVHDGTVE